MSNKNKKNAPSAAEQAAKQSAPETNNSSDAGKSSNVAVIQLGDLSLLEQMYKNGNMDHNRIMDMIRVQHETFRMDPKAAENTGMSPETIQKINMINAVEQVALMASVVTYDKTPFAIAMRSSQLEAIKEAASMLNVNIDLKALPAPDKNGVVSLPSDAIKPSAEAKKAIAEEKAASEKKVELDPTKIVDTEQLKESLKSILVKGTGDSNFYDKVLTAINFYESYMSIQASKSENKEEELAALKEKSRSDFLMEIANLLGKCTFTVGGMAKALYENTERTKSPVVAFCMFRDASLNKKTGMPQIDDSAVADITKVLIRWHANSEIETTNRIIESYSKNLEALKDTKKGADAKKNEKAIKEGEKVIENAKKHLEHVEEVVSYAYAPSREVIDSFEEDYTDSTKEGYKMARMMGSKILGTYYPGIKPKEVKQESLVHNLREYMGIISNMFLPSTGQFVEFSEGNITELEKAEPSSEEEKNA